MRKCASCSEDLSGDQAHILQLCWGPADEYEFYETDGVRWFCNITCLAENFGYTPGLR